MTETEDFGFCEPEEVWPDPLAVDEQPLTKRDLYHIEQSMQTQKHHIAALEEQNRGLSASLEELRTLIHEKVGGEHKCLCQHKS